MDADQPKRDKHQWYFEPIEDGAALGIVKPVVEDTETHSVRNDFVTSDTSKHDLAKVGRAFVGNFTKDPQSEIFSHVEIDPAEQHSTESDHKESNSRACDGKSMRTMPLVNWVPVENDTTNVHSTSSNLVENVSAEFDPASTGRKRFLDSQRPGIFLTTAWKGNYSECSTLKQKAELAWHLAFNRVPYTDFRVIEDLLKEAKITHKDLLKDFRILNKKYQGKDQELQDIAMKLQGSQDQENFGRCTSFAVEVATALSKNSKGDFNFEYYDLKKHRVARCTKTNTYIDSMSGKGPFILREGEWVIHSEQFTGTKWLWDRGESLFKTVDHTGKPIQKSSKIKLDATNGLFECIRETAKDKNLGPLCFFRSFRFPESDTELGTIEYHGMIKWLLKDKQLLLIPDLRDPSRQEEKIVYVWEKNGTGLDRDYCALTLQNFVYAYGGSYGDGQWWECQGLQSSLWMAAMDEWGYPRKVGSMPGSKPKVYFKEEATPHKTEYKSWDNW